jgi:serine/threonine-protein kinase
MAANLRFRAISLSLALCCPDLLGVPSVATRKIAGYTIVREHARGGMGTVYQALSPEGATVAIKTVLWPESADPRGRWEAIERFQREARAARSLSHPNICQVLDFGADEDSLYIVMEFLDGQTVRDMISLAGAIRADRAVEIASSAGEALAHAHDQGVVHRDVKPENIMILRGGQAKLTDFGLASVASERTLTMPGTTMGTVYYMSPEQVRGEKLDARSDIFSLGATLYEMLTGVRAFQAEEPAAVMNQILTKDPPPLAGVPATIAETVEKCLRKDPGERHQSTRELIASLQAGAVEPAPSAITAVPTTSAETARASVFGLPRALRRWPVLAAVAAALAVGAVALFQPWTRLGGQPTTTEVTAEAPSPSADVVPAGPEPPPPLGSPGLAEADVRDRANFFYPGDSGSLQEDFVIGASPWGNTDVEGDALVLQANRADGVMHGTPVWEAAKLSEFVIEVLIEKQAGPDDVPSGPPGAYGVSFIASPGEEYYGFNLRGNGQVVIAKLYQSEWTRPAGREEVPEVNRGNAKNRLKAVRRGAEFYVFVNDTPVLEAQDFDISYGCMWEMERVRSSPSFVWRR